MESKEALTLLSYNTLASFGDKKRQTGMVHFVNNVSPDIAYFAEAYSATDDPRVVDVAASRLEELGYQVTKGLDGDAGRVDATGFFGIVRNGLGEGSLMSADTRQGYMATVKIGSKTLRIGGMHFDDRTETSRLHQAKSLPKLDVLMGDFNAMHHNVPVARVLQVAKPFTQLFKEVDPNFLVTTSRVKQAISLAQRLTRMADGTLLKYLSEQGLDDIDPHHEPTIHHVAQIDHIVATGDFHPSNYRVHNSMNLSDHKPISATLHF